MQAASRFEPLDPPSGRGRLVVIPDLTCAPLADREVFVWTSDGVGSDNPAQVLYMQDGQNLFDPARGEVGAAWEIDASVSRLLDAGRVGPTIVVGVACSDRRLADYAPHDLLSRAGPRASAAVEAAWGPLPPPDAYSRLVVERIKPLIDTCFPTRPERGATFVAGSSMGGVAALDLLARYPEIFAGAAALSAHLCLLPVRGDETIPGDFQDRMTAGVAAYGTERLPPPGGHRLWVDRGDQDLDAIYGPVHDALTGALLERGYRPDVDLVTRVYPGAGHNEAAWRDRLDQVMAFLLAPAG